eukprot:scaffold436740_cov17-Prasinocladus_malaysianus.AAC.1
MPFKLHMGIIAAFPMIENRDAASATSASHGTYPVPYPFTSPVSAWLFVRVPAYAVRRRSAAIF